MVVCPDTVKLVSVPTLVTLGCAFVLSVPIKFPRNAASVPTACTSLTKVLPDTPMPPVTTTAPVVLLVDAVTDWNVVASPTVPPLNIPAEVTTGLPFI